VPGTQSYVRQFSDLEKLMCTAVKEMSSVSRFFLIETQKTQSYIIAVIKKEGHIRVLTW
jgi:hypothetical protein